MKHLSAYVVSRQEHERPQRGMGASWGLVGWRRMDMEEKSRVIDMEAKPFCALVDLT